MKIDLRAKIIDFAGEPISGLDQPTMKAFSNTVKETVEEVFGESQLQSFLSALKAKTVEHHLTVGKICRTVLANGTEKMKPDKKLECFNIGLKCVSDTADLSDAERQLILSLIDESGYSPVVYGRISQLFESKDPDEEAGDQPKKKSKK